MVFSLCSSCPLSKRPLPAKYKFSLSCGLLSFNRIKNNWCETCGKTFCVTPENIITSCIEICNKEDVRINTFKYGDYDQKTGNFSFELEKLQNLSRRTVNNLSACKDCFAKYFCAGGCLAKMNGNDVFDISLSQTCKMNKIIIEEYLKRLFIEQDPEVLEFLKAKQDNTCS